MDDLTANDQLLIPENSLSSNNIQPNDLASPQVGDHMDHSGLVNYSNSG